MQTYSLPSTPWVQVRLGVPSLHGLPVVETQQGTQVMAGALGFWDSAGRDSKGGRNLTVACGIMPSSLTLSGK